MYRIIISGCLLGERVRYDGKVIPEVDPIIEGWQKKGWVLPACPEVLGGMSVPRPPAEIVRSNGSAHTGNTRVVNIQGEDVTDPFLNGAEKTLELAMAHGIKIAVLKERSPSCGSSAVYDGTFSGVTIPGEGLTCALLRAHGIRVFSESELQTASDLIDK